MFYLSTQEISMHYSKNIDYAHKPNSKVILTFGIEAPISSGDMNVI
jgi:hypothetical protein